MQKNRRWRGVVVCSTLRQPCPFTKALIEAGQNLHLTLCFYCPVAEHVNAPLAPGGSSDTKPETPATLKAATHYIVPCHLPHAYTPRSPLTLYMAYSTVWETPTIIY